MPTKSEPAHFIGRCDIGDDSLFKHEKEENSTHTLQPKTLKEYNCGICGEKLTETRIYETQEK